MAQHLSPRTGQQYSIAYGDWKAVVTELGLSLIHI